MVNHNGDQTTTGMARHNRHSSRTRLMPGCERKFAPDPNELTMLPGFQASFLTKAILAKTHLANLSRFEIWVLLKMT